MWNFIQGNIYGFNVSGMAQSQSIFIFKISNCEIFSGGINSIKQAVFW